MGSKKAPRVTMVEPISDNETMPDNPPLRSLAFERAGPWSSSFHGDRYFQEDIYRVTDHVKVGFDDIFTEPAALRSGDIGQLLSPHVRKIFSLIFIYTQAAIYYFMTLLTGMFLGLTWGVIFGVLHYFLVWLVHPTIKIFFIFLRVLAMPTRTFVRAFIDPLFQAIGQVFSFISAKFRLRVMGMDYGCPDSKAIRQSTKPATDRPPYPQEWLGFV